MLPILRPIALSARTADSRPGPGPLMRTSMFFTPHSCAARPARSAAACAVCASSYRVGALRVAIVAFSLSDLADWHVQLDCRLARSLPGTRVGASALAAHRQALAVPRAAVALQVDEPLDRHLHLAAQV